MEIIYETYRNLPPEGSLFNNGSQLFKLLKGRLNIKGDNPISQQRRLIYLNKFYRYIESLQSDEYLQATPWNTKEALMEQIIDVMRNVLRRQEREVNTIVKAPPCPEQLKANFVNIEDKYIEAAKAANQQSWIRYLSSKVVSTPLSHLPQARFIDFILEYCRRTLDIRKVETVNIPRDTYFKQAETQLRYAVALYVMMQIEKQYQNGSIYGSYAIDSVLYKIISGPEFGINLDSTKNLKLSERVAMLTVLGLYVDLIIDYEQKLIQERIDAGHKELKEDLETAKGEIAGLISILQKEKITSSKLEKKMESTTSGVTKYTINAGISTLFGNVLPTGLGVAADIGAGAAFGTFFAVFGPGGIFLGTTAFHLMRTHLLPMAIAGICSDAIEATGNAVGKGVTGVVMVPVTLTHKMMQALARLRRAQIKEPDKEALLADLEWIDVLLDLPEKAFEEKNKVALEHTSNYKRPIATPSTTNC